MSRPTGELILRRALAANAAFSLVSGIVLTAAAGPIAPFLGDVAPLLLRVTGPALVLFAVWVGWIAASRPLRLADARQVVYLDAAWVVGSLVLLAIAPDVFTRAGWWTVMGVAEVVGIFAGFQYYGLRLRGRPVST